MPARPTLPALTLSLILLAAIPAGAPPAQSRPAVGAPAATPTPAPPSPPPAAAPPQVGSAVPTAGPGVSTPHVAPDWTGLPVRTYANLTKKILGDPINIAFEGTQRAIVAAFAAIGWQQADPLSVRHDARLAEDAVAHRSYPTAPVSNLYLFGRPEDFAVEHERGSVAQRDHARFWDTTRRDRTTGLDLFIGDASRDIAIKVLRTATGLPKGTTHKIDGDLDAERTLIVDRLRAAGLVTAVVLEPGMGRTTTAVNGGGDRFTTDGRVAVVVLKAR